MSDALPVVPRPAATILLIRDDPFEVLMIRRREGDSFGSALVFPGGVVDPEDHDAAWLDRLVSGQALPVEERALRIAGLREVYEEAGLIAAAAPETSIACETGAAFTDVLGNARLDLEALVPFGHWVTPDMAARRFDTHFYLCRAPLAGEAICDGIEAVAVEWATPDALLARAATREQRLLFPTRMNLARLAESHTVSEALEAARDRPPFTVHPRVERCTGGVINHIPAAAGYPATEMFTPF